MPSLPSAPIRRLAVLLALCAGVLVFLALDLGRFLELEQLRRSRADLAALQARAPVATALAYVAVYIAATTLSLPGATLLTLAGGAVFGLVQGTVLVSLASTAGATLAMLAARTVLRDLVERRHGARLGALHRGIEREGAFYLFTLRLVPAMPFFLLNLLMGLTHLRTTTYAWVSWLGMLPATVAYVYAGTELARIDTLRGILSPGLIAAFVVLGLLPLVLRRLLAAWRRQHVQARWRGRRPRRFDRNLVVIGAGAAGLVSAYVAAALRARVTLVEAHRMGGDCLHTGCVPSKALIHTARLHHQARQGAAHGLRLPQAEVDWPAIAARLRRVVADIAPHDSVERYTALGVDVVQGHARIVDPWHVEIRAPGGERSTLSTRAIVIAAGASPVLPGIDGLADVQPLTTETLWEHLCALPALPRRMLVLGGGPIGCELAQALARLGVAVTLIEQGPRLLAREDTEVAALVRGALEADGVVVRTGQRVLRFACVDAQRWAVLADAPGDGALPFDALLVAVGRAARVSGYGLEELGIEAPRTVETDEYLQTLHPNIYAAGDATATRQFTHLAAHQAWYATVNALLDGWWRLRVDTRVLPQTVFVDPEVARVGLDPDEARAQGIPFEATRYDLDDLDRAIADGRARGFVRVLTPPGRDRILGVTIVGERAAELLAPFVLAMQHGIGLGGILRTVHAYPTYAEAARHVAGAWRRARQPERLLRLLQRVHDWRRG